MRISIQSAEEAGYFFPLLSSSGSVFNADLVDIMEGCYQAYIPTMISLIAFSLIHATINIPAFAVYVEPDMNAELIAHR